MMGTDTIHVNASVETLFGDDYAEKLGDDGVRAIQEALEDGIVDQSDFESQGAEFDFSDGASFENFKSRFVKGFYYGLGKFSKRSGDVHVVDTDGFREWTSRPILISLGMDGVENPTPIDAWRSGTLAFVMADDLKYPSVNMNSAINPSAEYRNFESFEDGLLVVTHPSAKFDPFGTTTDAIDEQIESAVEKGNGVVYLVQASDSLANLPLKNHHPDFLLASYEGKAGLKYEGDHLIMIGGFNFMCQADTVNEMLRRRKTEGDLEIDLPTEALLSVRRDDGQVIPFSERLKLEKDRGRDISSELDFSVSLYTRGLADKYNYKVCYNRNCHNYEYDDTHQGASTGFLSGAVNLFDSAMKAIEDWQKPTVRFNFRSEDQ
jgi:hypothetical protein